MSKPKNILRSWWMILIILLSAVIIYFIWASEQKLERIDKKIYPGSME